ncbi:MAG TPA: DUF493 family protein [Ottowia sp.]|uniref:YbeD family protein n=1 Tax=Ottowia sp. TaxID=1898956 RepID=UPI002CC1B130|nr:DUF493 family protein [Ottowia sp.]HMN22726.1 DUF493 family protein [Ottowia sp.]
MPAEDAPAPAAAEARRASLLEFPCAFPIKVMGRKQDGFVHALTQLARQHDPDFDAATVELRESRQGNYLGVTLTVTATSQAQLDALYRALTSHPMVKVVF